MKFATFAPERRQLKLLRGYLILVRVVIVIVISILASLFMEHSVKVVFDCLFVAVMFLDLLFVLPVHQQNIILVREV